MYSKNLIEVKKKADEYNILYNKTTSKEKLLEQVDEMFVKDGSVKLKDKKFAIKRLAMKVRKVIITSNDQKDVGVSAVKMFFENENFSVSRLVPLSTQAELPQCIIDIAKETNLVIDEDEIIDGKPTGNHTYKIIKKYNVN